jgi:hypothetical protein
MSNEKTFRERGEAMSPEERKAWSAELQERYKTKVGRDSWDLSLFLYILRVCLIGGLIGVCIAAFLTAVYGFAVGTIVFLLLAVYFRR